MNANPLLQVEEVDGNLHGFIPNVHDVPIGQGNVNPPPHNFNADALVAQFNVAGFISLVRYFSGEPGTVSISEFLASINSAAELGSWTVSQKVAVLKSRLVGPALLYLRASDFPAAASWAYITAAFRDWYCEAPPTLDPLHTFYQCAQRPQETAKAFVIRLKLAGIAAINSGVEDVDRHNREQLVETGLLTVFVSGLRDDSGAQFLLMNPPASIEDAVRLAATYEQKHLKKKVFSATFQEPIIPQPPSNIVLPRPSRPNRSQPIPLATTESSLEQLTRQLALLIGKMEEVHSQQPSRGPNAKPPAFRQDAAQQRGFRRESRDSRDAPRPRQQPDIMCYRCGFPGHYANKCGMPNNPDRQRLRCNNCDKSGHSARECGSARPPTGPPVSQDSRSHPADAAQNFERR